MPVRPWATAEAAAAPAAPAMAKPNPGSGTDWTAGGGQLGPSMWEQMDPQSYGWGAVQQRQWEESVRKYEEQNAWRQRLAALMAMEGFVDPGFGGAQRGTDWRGSQPALAQIQRLEMIARGYPEWTPWVPFGQAPGEEGAVARPENLGLAQRHYARENADDDGFDIRQFRQPRQAPAPGVPQAPGPPPMQTPTPRIFAGGGSMMASPDMASAVQASMMPPAPPMGGPPPQPQPKFSNPLVLQALARGINKTRRLMLPAGVI
jgi:hypothetical protein